MKRILTVVLLYNMLSMGYAEAKIVETFPAEKLSGIEADIGSCDMRVEAWDNISIEVQQLPDTSMFYNVTMEIKDKHFVIKADWKDTNLHAINRKIGLIVKVPKNFSSDIVAGNGSIVLKGISGKLKIKTVNGDISGTSGSSDADISTSNGKINIKGLMGLARTQNANGDTKLNWEQTPSAGEITAKSSNGNIDITFPAVAKFTSRLNAVHGKTYNAFSNEAGFNLTAENANGNISVKKN